jgi:uncharacterized protein (DUF433 family)
MPLILSADRVPLAVDTTSVGRVSGTRVPLETVVVAFANGATAEEIVQRYPSLDLADVYAVLSYYLRHRQDVDTYVQERHRQAAAIRTQNQTRHDPSGVRERLLARRTMPRR